MPLPGYFVVAALLEVGAMRHPAWPARISWLCARGFVRSVLRLVGEFTQVGFFRNCWVSMSDSLR